MRHLEYDIKVAATIKAFRKLRQVKQSTIAKVLNMDQSTYSRVEQGEIAITLGQLKIIAKELRTSNFQLLAIVEADDLINLQHTSLSDILLKFVLLYEDVEDTTNLTEQELEFIITKIRERYKSLIKN